MLIYLINNNNKIKTKMIKREYQNKNKLKGKMNRMYRKKRYQNIIMNNWEDN